MIPEGFVLIPGYTQYLINKEGKVYRIEGLRGKIFVKGNFLKPTENKKRWGYMYVSLIEPGIKRKNWLLHRLVALTFIPNPDKKPQVNHKNGIKNDNRVENLEWVTDRENKKHGIDNGLVYQCMSKCRYKKDGKFQYYAKR